MKKILFVTLIFLLVILCGCKRENSEEAFDEPPVLMIANGQSESEAKMFGYTWETKAMNGKSTLKIADVTDQFDDVESLPVISIRPTYVSTINPMNAYLMFDIIPDNVTVRCWDSKTHNEDSAEVEILDAHLEDGTYYPDIILKLKNKNCIYEVTAEWNNYEIFSGKATYYFRTDGEIINYVNAIVIE